MALKHHPPTGLTTWRMRVWPTCWLMVELMFGLEMCVVICTQRTIPHWSLVSESFGHGGEPRHFHGIFRFFGSFILPGKLCFMQAFFPRCWEELFCDNMWTSFLWQYVVQWNISIVLSETLIVKRRMYTSDICLKGNYKSYMWYSCDK